MSLLPGFDEYQKQIHEMIEVSDSHKSNPNDSGKIWYPRSHKWTHPTGVRAAVSISSQPDNDTNFIALHILGAPDGSNSQEVFDGLNNTFRPGINVRLHELVDMTMVSRHLLLVGESLNPDGFRPPILGSVRLISIAVTRYPDVQLPNQLITAHNIDGTTTYPSFYSQHARNLDRDRVVSVAYSDIARNVSALAIGLEVDRVNSSLVCNLRWPSKADVELYISAYKDEISQIEGDIQSVRERIDLLLPANSENYAVTDRLNELNLELKYLQDRRDKFNNSLQRMDNYLNSI